MFYLPLLLSNIASSSKHDKQFKSDVDGKRTDAAVE